MNNVDRRRRNKNIKRARVRIKTLKHQQKLINSKSKYPALVAGYGSGKTEAGIFRILNLIKKNGLKVKEEYNKRYKIGVYQPTYDLIKLILYPRFEQILNQFGIKYILNKSDKVLYIDHFNTTIIFRSMDNDERIIGYETNDFWIDELDTLKKKKAKFVFEKITDRNRAKNPKGEQNTGCITTTPEGYRFVYDAWKKEPKKGYELIKGSTKDNPFLPKDYLDDLYDKYDKKTVLAYVNGEFVNLNADQVYYTFSRKLNNTNLELSNFDENEILHIGMDFNVGKMSAVIAIHNKDDNELYILEEIKNVLDTPNIIRILKERYKNRKIRIYPDASSKNRKSVDASKSDLSLLKAEKNFEVSSSSKNPFIKDRVLAVNSLFCNAKDIRRLYINVKNCKELVNNIEQQTYDEKTGQPDKTQGHDHIIDALGYLVYKLYPINRQKTLKE